MALFVSTPCYGGICLQAYAESILALHRICLKRKIPMMYDSTENESLITRARNVSIARFYKNTRASHFLFIDADISFDPETVIRLIQSNHDVAVAVYPKKCVMWNRAEARIDSENLDRVAASLALNFKGYKTPVIDGFAEVLDGPTGFMLIKREVIARLYEAYPELNCVNDHENKDTDTYCAIFDCMIDPDTRRYLSEDYAFCRRWQKIGGKIFADVTAVLGHVGNIRFQGKLENRLSSI